MALYKYGMRLRGYSPMAQPMEGIVFSYDPAYDTPNGKYHSILFYDRKLTEKEVSDYELDYLGETNRDY